MVQIHKWISRKKLFNFTVSMMTRIASLVLCLAAAAQSYLVYVPRAPHSLYQLPWLAAEHGIHPDTVDYECQADGVFPDLASHCKKYFVCNAGTVSRYTVRRFEI